MNETMRGSVDSRLQTYRQHYEASASWHPSTTLRTSLRFAALTAAALLISFLVLLPEARGSWVEVLTINGTVETGRFVPSSLDCTTQGSKDGSLTWSAATGA